MTRAARLFAVILAVSICGCPQNPATLTAEQTSAVRAAVAVMRTVAGAAGGILPAGDLQAFINRFPDGLPTCPTLDMQPGDGSIIVTLDFGAGCTPQMYPDATFGGSITGAVFVVERTVELTFNGFRVNDDTFNGTLSASVVRLDGRVTFEGELDLTIADLGSLTGSFNTGVDAATGEITVRTATLDLHRPSGPDVHTVVDDLVMDPAEHGNFLPESGVAVLTYADVEGDPVTVNVGFSETTPTNGTVTVSVNNGPTITIAIGM
jgi:hypothetical protein